MKKTWFAVRLTAAALLLSGCGGDATATEEPTTKATPSASATKSLSSTTSGANGDNFQAFQTCLAEAGIELPQRGANQDPAARPSYTAEEQAAFDKCRELVPAGAGAGLGAGGGIQNNEQFQAFMTCMKDQGVTVTLPTAAATPQARPSAGAGGLGGGAGTFGLDRDDPKVAAALEICEPLLPQRGAGASGGALAATK